MAECSSCGREIEWVQVFKSGKRMPIDVFPKADGNVRKLGSTDGRTGCPMVEVLGPRAVEASTDERFVPHFRTCPHADKHRRK